MKLILGKQKDKRMIIKQEYKVPEIYYMCINQYIVFSCIDGKSWCIKCGLVGENNSVQQKGEYLLLVWPLVSPCGPCEGAD